MKRLILILLTMTFMQSSCETPNSSKLHTNFVHVVYFWLHNPDSAEAREEFETSLKKFLETSKYANTNFIGTPAQSERGVVDDSFSYSLVVSFDSAEAQDLYQKEEAHLLFIKEASHLWSKVQVYDSNQIK